eukprot:scaffold1474_cov132-Cylindrotheca_fusiformis.AAC.1
MNSTASSVVAATSSVVAGTDPTALLNTQLSSALSTLGDAQFWEETISPATVRSELSAADPSNPNSTSTLQRGMKWLLASISKGRDVSDFYPHVVKLVGATSLEVRKMVFMYLVQYADHDATTRELSLLSINSFQRGLADHEQLIRGLALRVLSSIRIQDILQIQILGVQKCVKDSSPYVRKCAANALAKLNPRCDAMQREMLLEIMKNLLDVETSTMVLASALIAFVELCPERLDMIHSSFRKICHLLTDLDEWGQVVVIDMLARYCRTFFKEPRAWKNGTAERIDRERRVYRDSPGPKQVALAGSMDGIGADFPTTKKSDTPKKIRRRVVKKGFYSDEEDSSTEEEVYAEGPSGKAISTASAMRQRNILGLPGVEQPIKVDMKAKEDMDLDEDHRLLLDSSMPLLKSRNAGVVLSVCSLHYYCGVSSIRARSAIGKALVRIHRDRREIQYVVLTSIQTLVHECPSAFAPFLPDFFVKVHHIPDLRAFHSQALDPPFTRLIKIDILTCLALEPAAIEVVLKELRMYIRSADTKFVCASIRAVGKVVELSRIVYDRHGAKSGDVVRERETANRIALDCLHGLTMLTQNCDSNVVVGEAISVMQNILLMLISNTNAGGSHVGVGDPNGIQGLAMRRIILLVVSSLSGRVKATDAGNEGSDNEHEDQVESGLGEGPTNLPPSALAAALWLVSECMSNINHFQIPIPSISGESKVRARLEIVRLVGRAFPDLDLVEKEQGIHFASKLLVSGSCGTIFISPTETAVCEHILAMGRVDVNPDIKDRARFESSVIQSSIGLKHDTSGLEASPAPGNALTLDIAEALLLEKRLAPSFLPMDDAGTIDHMKFRFGTLSSLVGHKARDAYLPLPPWGLKNSAKSLRDPSEIAVKAQAEEVVQGNGFSKKNTTSTGFYDSSSSGSSADTSSSESSDAGSDGDDSSSSSSSDESGGAQGLLSSSRNAFPTSGFQDRNLLGFSTMNQPGPQRMVGEPLVKGNASSDDDSSSSGDDSDSSESSSSDGSLYNGQASTLNALANPLSKQGDLLQIASNPSKTDAASDNNGSATIDDLRGLVMAPIVAEESTLVDTSGEYDSSSWMQLVRPELCGGLAARARYMRGKAKSKEVRLVGLDPDDPAIVCLQIQFKNK